MNNLIFAAKDLINRDRGLTFDDVLIVPNHSEISSRKTPSLETKLTKKISLKIPLISANMDTITEIEMAKAMAQEGGLGIIHRFMALTEQVKQVAAYKAWVKEQKLEAPSAASIGVKEEGQERAIALAEIGIDILTIDIAHGDSVMMYETLSFVKKEFPHIEVIAGNVATAEGVRRLIDHGADCVKIGIGPGSMCTTRIITGCGVPQLTAIALAAQEAMISGVPTIADGGIKNSGDMVKALCAGASAIMCGSLFSGTLETPGEVVSGRKKYRGMASKDAQVSWRGDLPQGMAPEGEDTFVNVKGSVHHVIAELCGGVRSAMSYINAVRLTELSERCRFIEMSPSGMSESRPHGLRQ
jgi:IMP dehydrogenase